jgi:hypothetical protein
MNSQPGDGLTESAHSAAPGAGAYQEADGPTASCSITALVSGDRLSAAEARHLIECAFCSRLAARLARLKGTSSV